MIATLSWGRKWLSLVVRQSELRNKSEFAIVQAIGKISRTITGHRDLLIGPICLSEELQRESAMFADMERNLIV